MRTFQEQHQSHQLLVEHVHLKRGLFHVLRLEYLPHRLLLRSRHHRVLGNRPSRVAHPALGPDAGANILPGLVFVGNLQSLSVDFGL